MTSSEFIFLAINETSDAPCPNEGAGFQQAHLTTERGSLAHT